MESPIGKRVTYAIHFYFKCSNNKVKHKALLAGLQLDASMHILKVKAYNNSMLVVNQINGSYQAKEENIKKYLMKEKEVINNFNKF